MKERSGITAAGTWMVDYTKTVSRFPAEGACTTIVREGVNNGGAPYNLLIDLRRLGVEFPLRAIGCVGRDVDGASILDDCRAHQIHVSRMRVTPECATSFSDVMICAESGIRTSFNHPGANALLGESDCDIRRDSSRIFYLGTLLFLQTLDGSDARHGTRAAAVLAGARSRGMLTCIDVEKTSLPGAVVEKGIREALRQTDLPIFNVEVAEILTGVRLRCSTGLEIPAVCEAAEKLLEMSRGQCVVIRSPTVALALSASGEVVVEGSVLLPKSRIRGSAGAGHAFTAGFLHRYHDEHPLAECLQAAHAAAASCLLDPSTSGGIRSLPACLKLLAELGQREVDAMKAGGSR
jgi:sugar/nucleoside kinase (ribokinase family)